MVPIFRSTQFHGNMHIYKCRSTEGTGITPAYLVFVQRCVWFVQVLVICFSFLFILGLTWLWLLHRHFFPRGNFRVTLLLKPLITLSSYYKIIEFITAGFEGICTSTHTPEDSLVSMSFLVCPWVSLLLPGHSEGPICVSIPRMEKNFLAYPLETLLVFQEQMMRHP